VKGNRWLRTTNEPYFWRLGEEGLNILQEINISHLGKRKIIFKMDFSGDMLVPWRVSNDHQTRFFLYIQHVIQRPGQAPKAVKPMISLVVSRG